MRDVCHESGDSLQFVSSPCESGLNVNPSRIKNAIGSFLPYADGRHARRRLGQTPRAAQAAGGRASTLVDPPGSPLHSTTARPARSPAPRSRSAPRRPPGATRSSRASASNRVSTTPRPTARRWLQGGGAGQNDASISNRISRETSSYANLGRLLNPDEVFHSSSASQAIVSAHRRTHGEGLGRGEAEAAVLRRRVQAARRARRAPPAGGEPHQADVPEMGWD